MSKSIGITRKKIKSLVTKAAKEKATVSKKAFIKKDKK